MSQRDMPAASPANWGAPEWASVGRELLAAVVELSDRMETAAALYEEGGREAKRLGLHDALMAVELFLLRAVPTDTPHAPPASPLAVLAQALLDAQRGVPSALLDDLQCAKKRGGQPNGDLVLQIQAASAAAVHVHHTVDRETIHGAAAAVASVLSGAGYSFRPRPGSDPVRTVTDWHAELSKYNGALGRDIRARRFRKYRDRLAALPPGEGFRAGLQLIRHLAAKI